MGEQEDALTSQILRQRAEREAHAVLEEARREAREAVELAVERATQRAARQEHVGGARLDQQVAALRLQRQKEALDRVRAEAREALARLADTEQGRGVLAELAVLAVEAMSGDRFELVLRPRDRERWGQDLARAVAAAVGERTGRQVQVVPADETVDARGGLIVRGAGGREVADQTFEARMDRLWEQIQCRVAPLVADVPEDQG